MNLFPADDRRLRELILHISLRCGDWEDFHPALLDRLLFQADFLHFRLHGYPITGQTYRRGVLSPAPRGMGRVVSGMIEAGELRIEETDLGDGLHVRRTPKALREPDLRLFDGQEIAVVERVIRFYRRSRLTGGEGPDALSIPWELARPREVIPYHLALVGSLVSTPLLAPPRHPAISESESDLAEYLTLRHRRGMLEPA
jgi:hypothetical protein